MRLRVLSFNVRNDQGDSRRTEFINRELWWIRPDLVAFQEIIHRQDHDQLHRLLEGTGLAMRLASNAPGAGHLEHLHRAEHN